MEVIRAPRRDKVIKLIRAEDKMKDAMTSAVLALSTTVAIALIGLAKCYAISPDLEKELIVATAEKFAWAFSGGAATTLMLGIREARFTKKVLDIKEAIIEKMVIKPVKNETEEHLNKRKLKALKGIVRKERKKLDGVEELDIEDDNEFDDEEETHVSTRSKS